jgi:transposase-like protein
MGILPTALDSTTTCYSVARRLPPQQRQHLALAALAQQSISALAREHHVSRPFIYRQRRRALDALHDAFSTTPPPDEKILFHLPVTRSWLRQFVLCAVLIGHTSLRGTQEMLDALLDFPVSLGWAQAVVRDAMTKAQPLNARHDLSLVQAAALDEIFQNGAPVLTVVDVASTYCCLLSREEHRDAATWGVRLLELQDQGFEPGSVVADFAKGLRAGQAQALPEVPCKGDVFHAQYELGRVVRFLENRAYAAMAHLDKLNRNAKADPAQRQAAAREQQRATALADDVATLAAWLRHDVLAVAGPGVQQRRVLYDFLVDELRQREGQCAHRLPPVRLLLAEHAEELLLFAEEVDFDIRSLAAAAKVPEAVVRELVAVQEMASTSGTRWRRDQALRTLLGARYHALSGQVEELREGVVRASSLVENLNSRLRNYFHLRREVGGGYLDLLRFFLNHRRFLRSERPARAGRSPAELLTGRGHAHWLEILGYSRYRRAA